MRLLKRKTDPTPENTAPEAVATDVAAEPVEVTPVEAPEGVRTCPTCQAPLADDQDWCLQCGSAQSRLGGRMPGMRAATTVAGLTAVLVAGAGAASYAALQDEPSRPAPATSTQVAQAPPASTPEQPSTSTPAPVDPPPTGPATVDPPIPDDPPEADVPDTPAPSADAGDAGTSGGSAGGDTSAGSGTSGGDTGSGSGGDGGTKTTEDQPEDTGPKVVALDAGAGSLYDPYTRDTAAGDPGKAFDGNITTSFPITVAEAPEGQEQQINAGLAIDLGKKRSIQQIELTLKTPGAGLEVYATDEAQLPPDVLDSRWAHLRSLKSAGSAVDGHQTITLGKGKYRHVLLWFTTPPKADATTVRVTELQILG